MGGISEVLVFIFASIGASHIVIEGKIFERPRNWLKSVLPSWLYTVFECYQCCGTYLGLICGWLVFPHASFWQLIACAFAGSFLSALGAVSMNFLEAKTIVNLNEK
jgi:hypothetical protein